MTEVSTLWAVIPIQVVVSFFGFFTITSVVVAFQTNAKKIAACNLGISFLFWIVLMLQALWGLGQMTGISLCQIDSLTFILFSLSWGFAVYPAILFLSEIRSATQLMHQPESED